MSNRAFPVKMFNSVDNFLVDIFQALIVGLIADSLKPYAKKALGKSKPLMILLRNYTLFLVAVCSNKLKLLSDGKFLVLLIFLALDNKTQKQTIFHMNP